MVDHIFADLDLDFGMHPFNRDVTKKYDEQAISRSIRNLVLTNLYERAFHPELGGSVRELLFEQADAITVNALETRIVNLIERQEPRVRDVRVEAVLNDSEDGFDCSVFFTAVHMKEPIKITLYLKRVR